MSGTHDDNTPDPTARHRPIRSVVLRQGRQTEAQKRAFELHWPALGLDYRGEQQAFGNVFGRSGPLVVEVGFGNGEQLLFAAERETGRDFIGPPLVIERERLLKRGDHALLHRGLQRGVAWIIHARIIRAGSRQFAVGSRQEQDPVGFSC